MFDFWESENDTHCETERVYKPNTPSGQLRLLAPIMEHHTGYWRTCTALMFKNPVLFFSVFNDAS
jgi:hypothetical protein